MAAEVDCDTIFGERKIGNGDIKMENRKHIILADSGIMFIALCWGLNFSVITWALSDITPMYYLSIRFVLSGLLLALIFMKSMKHITKAEMICGILSGVMLALSFAAQTIGLQYTTPGKAGFLVNATVVFMPLLVWVIYKKRPDIRVAVGALIAFMGLAVISLTENFTLQLGDILEILCALFFAIQTLIIDRYADRVNPVRMTVFQVLTAGVISIGFAAVTEPFPQADSFSVPVMVALIYAIVFCTALSFVVQGYAQKITPPSHVALILCFEAVFAFLFALIFGYEELTLKSVLGSIIVFAGFLIAQTEKRDKLEAAEGTVTSSQK